MKKFNICYDEMPVSREFTLGNVPEGTSHALVEALAEQVLNTVFGEGGYTITNKWEIEDDE